jgi:hypothetical protein
MLHPDSSDPDTNNEETADLEFTHAEASHSITTTGTRQTANIPQISRDISQLIPDDICVLLDVQSLAPRMIHIRNASMNDVLSDVSSTRTTIFSKQASITTKSSHSCLSFKSSKRSQPIDTLDLSTDKSDRRDDRSAQTFEPRTFFLSNARMSSNGTSKMQENMDSARSATVTRNDALLEFGTAHVIDTTNAHTRQLHGTEHANAQPHHINTLCPCEYGRVDPEFVSAPPIFEFENIEHSEPMADDYPYENDRKAFGRRKWYNKLSRTMAEVSGKAQELSKAAKKFGLSLRAFVH